MSAAATNGPWVAVPRDVLVTALRKARAEYARAVQDAGQTPGLPGECWAEFEALASYIPGEE